MPHKLCGIIYSYLLEYPKILIGIQLRTLSEPHGDLSSIAFQLLGLDQSKDPFDITTVFMCRPVFVDVKAKISGPG